MGTVTFNIINSRKRKAKPCAILTYSEKKGYEISIDDNADIYEVPALFIPFMEKGIKIIGDKWAKRWVEERICPPGRQNLGEVLRAHNLIEYDTLALLRSGKGKSSQDDFIVQEVIPNEKENLIETNRTKARKNIAEQIKNARLSQNMTQADLARKVGINQAALSRIEAAKTNTTIDLLSDIFTALKQEPTL